MSNLLFAEPQSVGQINFSGGLNITSLETLIADQDSPDLCNGLPDPLGSMSKRNGSERFINQSVSSFSFTSIQRVYISTISTRNYKALIGSSRDKVVISTYDAPNPQWVVISSNNALDQHYSYVTMNGRILMTGDKLTENVKQIDISISTSMDAFNVWNTSDNINPRGKYHIVANNYYILANVQISTEKYHLAGLTTYYASRIVFGKLNTFSSMTVQRFIDYNQSDGDEITGIGMLYGGSGLPGGDFKTIVNFFKPSSIGELSFTVLDLPSLGGNWVFSEAVKGIGCIAPRTLAQGNGSYIFLDKSGVLLWNGNQARNISGKIKPLIDDLIRSGRYKDSVGIYYPKRDQYWLSIEHPQKAPKGRNNYILVYDFQSGEWWPQCNILAQSFTVGDNQDDTGQLYYGDYDGYVHKLDVETRPDDSRKEISIDVMDSSYTWVGSTQNTTEVREGSASLKIDVNLLTTVSTMTRMSVLPLGEWHDKTRSVLDDKFQFKAFAHNITSITSLRIDFEVKNVSAAFDTNFTSVTISSNAFSGNRLWTTFEIPLSSFPARPDWTDLAIESVPFYNRFNIYGIRFVLTGVDISSVSIDDIRLAGARDSPLRAYRFTKLFDFQNPAFKNFGTMLLTMDKASDASFSIDIYNDFGQKIRTEKVKAETPKEILTFYRDNQPGLAILDSRDFSVKQQTRTVASHWNCFTGIMDDKKIVCGDRQNDRLISFSRADLSTFSQVYGSFGSGTSNFNLIHEISQFSGGYLIADLVNQRTKFHSDKNLGFVRQFGELGNGNTNYHQPTGVAADGSFFYVSDESNDRLLKMEQSTFGIVLQTPLNHNTIADSTLAAGDKYLFMGYSHYSSENNDSLEYFLEKRDKGTLELTQRVSVKPIGVSTGSYRRIGSIGLLGRYVLVPFSNDEGQSNIVFYIQKRLQSDIGKVVAEYASDQRFFTASGYSLSYTPLTQTRKIDLKVSGRYVQLKFYDDELDNFWRLYQMSPLAEPQPLTH